jgi:hypothetical protein
LAVDKTPVAGYSLDSNDVSAGSSRLFTARSCCKGMADEDIGGWKKF